MDKIIFDTVSEKNEPVPFQIQKELKQAMKISEIANMILKTATIKDEYAKILMRFDVDVKRRFKKEDKPIKSLGVKPSTYVDAPGAFNYHITYIIPYNYDNGFGNSKKEMAIFKDVIKNHKLLTLEFKDSWGGEEHVWATLKKNISEAEQSKDVPRGIKRCKRCGGTPQVTGDKHSGYSVECRQCSNEFVGSDDKRMTIRLWNEQNR